MGTTESLNFWLHLSNARLVPASDCTVALTDSSANYCGAFSSQIGYGRFTPKLKLPHVTYVTGGGATSYNLGGTKPLAGVGVVYLPSFTTTSGSGTRLPNAHVYYIAASSESPGNGPIRPSMAQQFDAKMDDEFPQTGNVRAHTVHTTDYGTNQTNCVNTAVTPNVYKNTTGSTDYCKIMIGAPF